MISKPTISVLMPVKNTGENLEECLESIVNQTSKDFELITIDDNSTDNSSEILNNYAAKDKRIKVFKNKGSGIIDALRLAYQNSKGDLITRMDSDDIMSLDKLSVLKTNLLTSGKGHIALGMVKYFANDELGEGFKNYESWLNSLIAEGNSFDGIYKECSIPSPCWMVYREDLDECNSFLPNDYPEDYDLAFRFYMKKLKPIACNKILHYWRDYSTRTSRTHEHYSDNTFLSIKTKYFLKQDYNSNKNLVIWGAGKKGKSLARKLLKQKINFYWICDNPKKIGKHIYNVEMLPFTKLEAISNSQSIVTVANTTSQIEISNYFKERNLKPNFDYYFFC